MEQAQATRYQLLLSLLITLLLLYWGYIRLIIVSSDDLSLISNNTNDDDVDLNAQAPDKEEEELFNEYYSETNKRTN